ncbi:MAG: amino acid ABC transporter permease [Ruminococcaceae bacterium]|nr:amino acid ABC transporter permease [Oscillospiraceae bacterium]
MSTIETIVSSLFEGFAYNTKLFILTLIIALPLGLLITLGTMTKITPIRWFMKTFVWIIRGTPLMLQLIVVFYAPGLFFNTPMRDRFVAAAIAFVINYAAYFSEIYRGGIESISIGQYEAGQVLGMTKVQVFFKVILFQVIKRIVPPMGNEIITLVKDTSLANVIGVAEIIMSAERFTKQGLISPLFATGLYFLIFVGALTLLLNYVEKRFNYYRG